MQVIICSRPMGLGGGKPKTIVRESMVFPTMESLTMGLGEKNHSHFAIFHSQVKHIFLNVEGWFL
jgi:hypothetical protein